MPTLRELSTRDRSEKSSREGRSFIWKLLVLFALVIQEDILFGCCINGDGVMNTQLANANSLAKSSFGIIDDCSVNVRS